MVQFLPNICENNTFNDRISNVTEVCQIHIPCPLDNTITRMYKIIIYLYDCLFYSQLFS